MFLAYNAQLYINPLKVNTQLSNSATRIADKRKMRAENMSPVDADLNVMINKLKTEADKLQYMNKPRHNDARNCDL